MLDLYKESILSQFEAALWMLHDCIAKCPADRWSGPSSILGKYEFWHVAYHVLSSTDLYLSANETSFDLKPEFYPGGPGDFENEYPSRVMDRDELRRYLSHCLAKLRQSIAAETEQSLRGVSGFDWLKFPRSEVYPYNMRHVMHHTGQLSAYLRRAIPEEKDGPKWGYAGWTG